jgi:hypothetical protein
MVLGPLGSTAQTATMALKPLTYEDLLFQLLRDANIKKFNARKSANPTVQLADCDFAISTCAD